jgi:hypothetical protein
VHEPDPSAPPPPGHAALAFVVGVALAASTLAIAQWERPATWREKAEKAESHFVSRVSGTAERAVSAVTHSVSEPLAPFATLALSRSDLPNDGTVSLSLGLPEPSEDAEPRPVTLLSIRDQRVYTTEGHLDEPRTTATIEVPVDFLQPGTYMVQVKTTERTPFPLRRYVVEVQ